jgi:uncharacterized protein YllA (UPF0747 family)
MASEDHDLEEIKTVQLEGKKFKWNTEQSGAVGRMTTDGLDQLAKEISGKENVFYEAYAHANNLAEAVREYVNTLYGKKGLLVLDADNPALKGDFKNIIRDDVLRNSANKLVEDCSNSLNDLGYKTQTYPREINFFYLQEGLRERIVKEKGVFKVLNTDLTFTEEEIKVEIENHPERFSPNVILRPVYQDAILPN